MTEIPNLEKKPKFEFLKTLAVALIFAAIIRSFCFEPFHIPSSSMKPNLLIGDYLFVSKYSYGYGRYSFPLGLNLFEGRFWQSKPTRGDVIVFRLPSNPKINYIKRLIGLPGDKIRVDDGVVYINGFEVEKNYAGIFTDDGAQANVKIEQFAEILPEGRKITVLDQSTTPQDNTGNYTVPQGHYFMMGDNRDNSQDSRFLNHVGYVPEENLIGRAEIIFFSSSKPIWKIWEWKNSLRFKRFIKKIE